MQGVDLHTCAKPPAICRLARTLILVGALLGTDECGYLRGRFHYPLGAGWSIAIRPESARRFRLDACYLSAPRSTLWTLDGEDDHLAGVVRELTVRIGELSDEILEGNRLI